MFSYFLIRSFITAKRKKNFAAFELLNFIGSHVCITAVKKSNASICVFYDVKVYKCSRFLKNMLSLDTLTNITPVCKQNLHKHSLD